MPLIIVEREQVHGGPHSIVARGLCFLKVAENNIYLMAQRGQVPAFKLRDKWARKHPDLDCWIYDQTAVVMVTATKDTNNV